ncbi:hypothetical protein ACFL9U_06550 [Thermodesulfobacteriota bacterium]
MGVRNSWKEFAWNGIRFRSPADWEAREIGKNYLLIEREFRPVLEIKWDRVKGTFSHHAHLHKLAQRQKKHLGKDISEWPLPAEWQKALETYEAIGFSWQGNSIEGKGVILYCPECRQATLMQFYDTDLKTTEQIAVDLLASFGDHSDENHVIWSVYDIRAVIPESFKLVRHRFEAGEFELEFDSGEHKITLWRWAPASIIFADKNLERFAQAKIPMSIQNPSLESVKGHEGSRWEMFFPPYTWARFWNRIKRRPSFVRFLIWHLEEKNRLMGIRFEGKNPIDAGLADTIVANYDAI